MQKNDKYCAEKVLNMLRKILNSAENNIKHGGKKYEILCRKNIKHGAEKI